MEIVIGALAALAEAPTPRIKHDVAPTPRIKHVVVLYEENRAFDHLLGTLVDIEFRS